MNKEILENLVNKHYSSYRIAKELNKSQTSISYWLKKYNLKTTPQKTLLNSLPPFEENNILFKICFHCKEKKPFDANNFYLHRGKLSRNSFCKTCFSKISGERLRTYKQEAVDYKGGKCQICGYDRYLGAFDFHHLDPSKKDFHIGGSSKSLESKKSELDKCILLCCRCHRELHGGIVNLPSLTNEINGAPMPNCTAQNANLAII